MTDLQRFKQLGFALARSHVATRSYRYYCSGTGKPFICVSPTHNKKLRVGIHLFRATTFTEEGKELLVAAFDRGSTRHRRPVVGTRNASANILPDKLQAVVEDVMALMADARVLNRTPRRAVDAPVVDSELNAA
jgi:hypothetical protein